MDLRFIKLTVIISVSLLCSCQSGVTKTQQEAVIVESARPAEGLTREQLDSKVRRFAQRYSSLMTSFYTDIRSGEMTPEVRQHVINYQLESSSAAVSIAMGENPVTNLLDMLVFATLSRMEAEEAQAAGVYNEEQSATLVRISHKLERDIWGVSDDVLTTQQQAELKALINTWREQHPGHFFIFRVRFNEFADVDSGGLGDIERTGGLLDQYARTLDEVESIRHISERLMYYLDFAPYLASMQAEAVFYNILQQPETQQTLDSTHRFALVVEQLPDARFEAINQLMVGIAAERRALINDIVDQQATISQTLSDLRPALETASVLAAHVNDTTQAIERTAKAVNLDLGGPPGEPIDIVAYQRLFTESAATVLELRLLVETLDSLSRSQLVKQQIPPAFAVFQTQIDDVVHRVFLLLILTIIVSFVSLYLYRRATYGYRTEEQKDQGRLT